MTTESQARQAFTDASKKLDAAIAEYSRSRRALHAITGQFVGHDDTALQRFCTQPSAADTPKSTDC